MGNNLNYDAFIFPVVSIFLLTSLSIIILRTKTRDRHGKKPQLPPGSLGWPYIGQTLQLYSQDPSIFLSSRQRRYGEIFKTHILGYPCVMVASAEAARFVLTRQAHLFRPAPPRSKENLIGPWALFFHRGEYLARLRKLVRGSLCPEAIRHLVPRIEAMTVAALRSWADGGAVINTFNEMKKRAFEVGILATSGHLEDHYREELKKNYSILDKGYNSFPTSLPGAKYQKALKVVLEEFGGDRVEYGALFETNNQFTSDDEAIRWAKNLAIRHRFELVIVVP